jgi:hypothetical protein
MSCETDDDDITLMTVQYMNEFLHRLILLIINLIYVQVAVGTETTTAMSGLAPSRLIPHPGYTQTVMENDIALVELERPLKFDAHVRAACLPQNGNNMYEGSVAVATGWGTTAYST